MDLLAAVFGRAPVMVPLTGHPGETALMTAPDAYDGYARLKPANSAIPGAVAARIAMHIGLHTPGKLVSRIESPVLFCVCNPDTVAPDGKTLAYARKAPRGEIRIYDAGHFDIYVGQVFDRVVTDQIDFLRRYVPLAG